MTSFIILFHTLSVMRAGGRARRSSVLDSSQPTSSQPICGPTQSQVGRSNSQRYATVCVVVRVEKKATSSAVSTATGVAKVTVNESQVDLLLDMLKTADITSTDPEENKTFVHLEGTLLLWL